MALFRAIESARPPRKRLFVDPLAVAFLDRRLRAAALATRLPVIGAVVPWYIDRRWPGPRLSGVVRTCVIDDMVREALRAGCSQLVLLGAGYDTRPYRLSEAASVDTFEVDHPRTQAVKRAALQARRAVSEATVRFVAVDFEHDSLADALDAVDFRAQALTCVVWEGVFSYLTTEAIDHTLRWITEACRPGSRVILTYVDEEVLRPTAERSAWVKVVKEVGEPFITGLDPRRAAGFFAARGLRNYPKTRSAWLRRCRRRYQSKAQASWIRPL